MHKHLVLGAVLTVTLAACGSVDPNLVTRPADQAPYQGDRAELVALGATLWQDNTLGTAGVACQSCHLNGAQFKATFKQPYPHQVAMAKSMSGLTSIDAAQMTQFCMLVPMKGQPLAWDSKELAALAAYIEDVEQKSFASK